MSTSTNDTTAPSGRPISVLERARALEARSSCGTAKTAVVGPSASRAATFVPSKVAGANSTSGAGSVGAPPRRSAGAAPNDTSSSRRYASIARLLDDADAEKSAPDVRSDNSSLAPTKIAAQNAPHGKSSGISTTTKKKKKQSTLANMIVKRPKVVVKVKSPPFETELEQLKRDPAWIR